MQSNVTLEMEESLLREANRLAEEENTSLSDWVAGLIAENLRQKQDYQAAKVRALARMERGFSLRPGRIAREELHER